jgi:hypothetical protein
MSTGPLLLYLISNRPHWNFDRNPRNNLVESRSTPPAPTRLPAPALEGRLEMGSLRRAGREF